MLGELLIVEDYPMRTLNSFAAGGSARYYAQPRNAAELEAVLEFAYRKSIGVKVIGGGTHILVPEEGIDALVISTKDMRGLTIKGDLVTAAPGEMLDGIINIAIDHNLVGMEELGGIPGTVAGAMTVNASANGKSLSDVFFYADYLTANGRFHRRPYYSDIFRKQVASDEKLASKPENVKEGIVRGKLSKLYKEVCFVDQAYVKDDSKSVSQVLAETGKAHGASLEIVSYFVYQAGVTA